METLKSENKKRVLPSWMTAPVEERRALSATRPKRKRMAAVQLGAATRAPATKTVYCMDEAEMVDMALEILIEKAVEVSSWLPEGARAALCEVAEFLFSTCFKAVVHRLCGAHGNPGLQGSGILLSPRNSSCAASWRSSAHSRGRKQEKPSLVATDKLQLSPPCSASPHTSSPGSSSEEEGSGNSSPALGPSPAQEPDATDSPCSRSPEEEEEEE
ncbi:cell cycle regulator of non-homologous end joining, partial [Onychomys torridus]|uniref:cell cycle regulator of non-homologous end joining n=1 Tax=Onychomys torridus TaxID=38674 RepID=UPI00167F4923